MREQVPWFRVKAYGYGAGLSCHWQDCVAISIYSLILVAVISAIALCADNHPVAYAAAIAIPTAILVFIIW
ncbi:hypothetical protein FP026_12635 [Rhizobium tropici]|uniref:Uncharacterized protein n=1 Tax=Rhizobium tropici TaxID=398 RepID=A0A5B0W2D4_RHITR|nr:hypothetical protein [Rhizobium tropici]KAA1181166.1 hypothetical protein FP026_12635 [Rhizobium tropici]